MPLSSRDRLFLATRDFALQLIDGLLSPPGEQDLSELTRHQLRELAALLDDDAPRLPIVPGGAGDQCVKHHKELREHIGARYVSRGATAGDCSHEANAAPPTCAFGDECFTGIVGEPSCSDCALEVLRTNAEWVSGAGDEPTRDWLHYADRVRTRNEREIQRRLHSSAYPRTPSGWGLAVLQRWNSFTPAMAASEGGGYFVYQGEPLADYRMRMRTGHEAEARRVEAGLVVDPGYGFVKNFLGERFGISDLTSIVVTHNHPDHLADFQALVNLVLELHKNRAGGAECDRGLDAILSPDSFDLLEPMITGVRDEVFSDTIVLAASGAKGSRVTATTQGFEVSAHLALHDNGSFHLGGDGKDSIGVVVSPLTGAHCSSRLGFPSDTKYRSDISKKYQDCDVVCLHLGGLTPEGFSLADYFLAQKTDWKVIQKKQHLYLPGVIWFLNDLCDASRSKRGEASGGVQKLVVMSEFGEELSFGLRLLISERLDEHAKHRSSGTVRVVPGDVGLLIDPLDRSIRCSCCGEFYPWGTSMRLEAYGESEQIFYVCPTCEQQLSPDQKASVFRRQQTPLMRMVGD